MKKRLSIAASAVALLVSGGALVALAAPAPKGSALQQTSPIPPGLHARAVCANVLPGEAHCMSFVLVDAKGRTFTSPGPSGLGPADLQDAYNLPSATHGAGMTVGIVDAYDDPNAEADMAVYRSTFGLPACTTANGCFRKVAQRGGTHYPEPNAGWAAEISLDLDMVSAICPNCNILLVEADGGQIRNLGISVNTAVELGADAVSNSYGNRDRPRNVKLNEHYYNHPGIAITVASGDSGYNNFRNFPAQSQYVTAVGGTALTKDGSGRGWTETAWAGAGSGCGTFAPKPPWQTDTGCTNRTYTDVSAVASPGTGVAVYDSYPSGGWHVYGGTSVSSPIIAGVYALAGANVQDGSRVYMNPGKLFDVTSGSNGSCGGSYLCTAGPGYDGPTGLGTPNGIGDF
jgi:subtilase family serine protease